MTPRSRVALGMIVAVSMAGSCSSKDQLLHTRDAAADALAMGGSNGNATGGAGGMLVGMGGMLAATGGGGLSPGTGGHGGAAGATNAGGAVPVSSGGMAGTSATGGGSSGTGGAATVPSCGNGTQDPGEDCDKGALNGVFYGDGSGCATNCTKEPVCRDGSGHNRACAAVCGDGNLDPGEGCDDGNRASGDGCSSACAVEGGYTCASAAKPATAPCQATGGAGTDGCLQLPVVYRDFKSSHESGGHPDFAYLSPTTPCVPDASGPSHCGVATPRTWGIVEDALLNGKPQLNGAPTGACAFVDWSHDTNGGHVPGYTMSDSPLDQTPYMAGPNGHPSFKGTVALVKDKSTFDQWFNDSAGSTPPNAHTVGTLELGAIGGGAYQFSSGLDVIVGGFYPLDPLTPIPLAGGEPLLCNLWPYWYSSPQFGAGNGCRGDQYLYPPSIPMAVQIANGCASTTPPGCVLGAWAVNDQGQYHDFWFTYEIHTTVTLPSGGFLIQVVATNDLFVFLNGVLVLDLGGTHGPLPGRLTVDGTTGTASVTEGGFLDLGHVITACPSGDPTDPMNTKQCPLPKQGDDCRTRTIPLGLKTWQTYELAIFGAQRHPTQSAFEIVASGVQKLGSVCTKP